MKTCSRCKRSLELSEFNNNKRAKDGLQVFCKKCRTAYYQENKERYAGQRKQYRDANKNVAASRDMKRQYGITQDDYNYLMVYQSDRCAICLTDEKPRNQFGETRWHIDHDHDTGKVRALLCGNCNKAIGLLQDDELVAANAHEYLKAFKENA